MPNIKSAKKRVQVNETKRSRNVAKKTELKTNIKKTKTSLLTKDVDVSKSALVSAVKSIDKAVSDGLLHKNTAARKKSKLQKSFNEIAK